MNDSDHDGIEDSIFSSVLPSTSTEAEVCVSPTQTRRRQSIIPSSHLPKLREFEPSTISAPNPFSFDKLPSINGEQSYLQGIVGNPTKDIIEDISDPSHKVDADKDDQFDAFIPRHFIPFSGSEDIARWLDATDRKFNEFKISRRLRFTAISLLVDGDAKRRYVKWRKTILSFDDFFEFLLCEFDKTPPASSLSSSHKAQSGFANDTLSISQDFSSKQPKHHSTKLDDLSDTKPHGDQPSMSSSVTYSNVSTMSLDQTTNDLRKAILQSFIKKPKMFHGTRDDVTKWLEELDHLFRIAHIPDTNKLDLISYSLRDDALQWYKNSRDSLNTWETFVKEIKLAFTSSFKQELAFKKLETYSQGINQSIRNFYSEMLKLCTEADPTMSETTKLKHLLSKTKPSIQFEVRRNKPTSLSEYLNYAKEAEELFQLSNMNVNEHVTSKPSYSTQTSSIVTTSPYDSSSQPGSSYDPRNYWSQQPNHPQFDNAFSHPQRPQLPWSPPTLPHLMDSHTSSRHMVNTTTQSPFTASSQTDRSNHPTQPTAKSGKPSTYQQRTRPPPDSQQRPTTHTPAQDPSLDRSQPQPPNL